jgi:hypothetical protein
MSFSSRLQIGILVTTTTLSVLLSRRARRIQNCQILDRRASTPDTVGATGSSFNNGRRSGSGLVRTLMLRFSDAGALRQNT